MPSLPPSHSLSTATVDKFISDNCGPFEDVAEETTELGDDNKLEYVQVGGAGQGAT